MRLVACAALALAVGGGSLHAQAPGLPIGFEETFALAGDRAAVLEQLIPGTEEAAYFRCLLLQHEGRLDEVEPLLRSWPGRQQGRTARQLEIERRQALLRFGKDPAGTFDTLRRELGLVFDHRRQLPGEVPDLPTQLDQGLIGWEVLARRALQADPGQLTGFTDAALRRLAAMPLDDAQLRALLGRLERPDIPDLPALVVRELADRRSAGFGALRIHRHLVLAQLEECARLRPELLSDQAFVASWLARLAPPADVDVEHDDGQRLAYLERLQGLLTRLPPSFGALAAHVIYHRLAYDLSHGSVDGQRLLEYLRLPREVPYANPDYLQRERSAGRRIALGGTSGTELPAVPDDEPLVRACLMQLFISADDWRDFSPYVRESYLTRLFAETKTLYGQGDMERWYALFDDPAGYEALKQRVELDFAPTQPRHFRREQPVVVELDVKHVPTLLVKVFELDAFNIYTRLVDEAGGAPPTRDIDVSLDLDGLVAHAEQTYTYEDSPLRRVRRRFEFPELQGPGVYVIEFIGNGLSSRTVVRKGQLGCSERVGAAGHVFRVYDEAGQPCPRASLWLAGKEYLADAAGEIVVPFSTDPGRRPIVLRDGELASLASFEHRAESYALRAGVFVERESLLAGATATLVVRPALLVQGEATSLALLKEPVLRIVSTDQAGVASSLDVRDLVLTDGADLLHEIRVPENLASLSVQLVGKVANLSRGADDELASSTTNFAVNGIDASAATACPLLGRTPSGYVLDLLGKNGEPLADVALDLELQPWLVKEPVRIALKTDARGRVALGPLQGIWSLQCLGPWTGAWKLLPEADQVWPADLHGVAGQTLRLPWPLGRSLDRSQVALFELRGGEYASDRFEQLALADGFLELRNLPAGEYSLQLEPERWWVQVRLTAGSVRENVLYGAHWVLPLAEQAPLHIRGLAADADALTIRLANAGPDARVHVSATRYLPDIDAFLRLELPPEAPHQPGLLPWAATSSQAGRTLSDEYRYILERRFQRIFPGNMLRRPSLLLNPWVLDETDTGLAGDGDIGAGFASEGRSGSRGKAAGSAMGGGLRRQPGCAANLDFLPQPAAVLLELRPDAEGVVAVPRAALGQGQLVTVVALDATSTVTASLVLPEQPLVPKDRRLLPGLDPSQPMSEQRRLEFVPAGASATLADVTTSEVELYDTLAAVFRLHSTLGDAAGLAEFAFLLQWPQLEREQKLQLYGSHACHELHLFLHQKDRPFFDEVVRPYLENKRWKTFMDEWLLERDLRAWLEPWPFGQLNVLERILLGWRLPDEAAAVERQLVELRELQPPDPQGERARFDAALRGGALDTSGSLGEAVQRLGKELAALGYVGGAPADEAPASRSAAETAAGPSPARAPAAREVAEEAFESSGQNDAIGVGAGQGGGGGGARADALTGRGRRLEADAARRNEQRALYRQVERTRESVESDSWHRRRSEPPAGLLPVNDFWLDLARSRGRRPFVSPHFAEATSSLNESLLALALLDLPFAADEPATQTDGRALTLTPGGPAVLVRRELLSALPADGSAPVLVGQDLFRLDERYEFVGNEQREKFVRGELLVQVVYGCQVVLSNPGSTPRRLELLVQLPTGALPVLGSRATDGQDVLIQPFSTERREFFFYFPAPGRFRMYPAQVAQDGRTLAAAEARELTVVAVPSTVDEASWEHVSQQGSTEQVLAFLEAANLQRLDLERIAWRMQDADVCRRVLALLRGRHVYQRTLWSYGLRHEDARITREFLEHEDAFVAGCGSWLESPLLDIHPIERRFYEHIEYEPLVNARAHRFGQARTLLNPSLHAQYRAGMDVLAHKPALDADDWLGVTYYLLLQDRVEEALASFARIDPTALETRLQYDATQAWLAVSSGDLGLARTIAEAHREHPVPRWRAYFADVLAQLDEAAGGPPAPGSPGERAGQLGALAASEPALELEVVGRTITLRHDNLAACELRFYAMDIEFLFSSSPFVRQGSEAFASIRPNLTQEVAFDPAGEAQGGGPAPGVTTLELPAAFHSANVLVEARAGGLVRRQPSFAHELAVQLIEPYGQLQVRHAATGDMLPSVYVKVYARTIDGGVRFHKDGYTDLRGRFDYASVSGDGLQDATAYAVLVLSADHGAVVREASPPRE